MPKNANTQLGTDSCTVIVTNRYAIGKSISDGSKVVMEPVDNITYGVNSEVLHKYVEFV